MQHSDFLKTLKTLKSQILQHQKNTSLYKTYTSSHKEKSTCTCTDAEGEVKYLYASKQELSYLLSKKDIKLSAYPCPYEKGWHLTKN